ncbi:hypothetical protein LSAT2_010175 [Lamellibrachia satsuma]|nr:hypothetical protein LSAT2_010175 [Lamellibrachia satsuma]
MQELLSRRCNQQYNNAGATVTTVQSAIQQCKSYCHDGAISNATMQELLSRRCNQQYNNARATVTTVQSAIQQCKSYSHDGAISNTTIATKIVHH